jgi:tetratricopeptide (TPR) repeat protein
MVRWTPALLLGLLAVLYASSPQKEQTPAKGQQEELKKERPAAKGGKYEVPPEEDTEVAPDNYSFNPLLAEKSLKIGNFYFKQGKYRAAEGRFRDATKWNDGYGEAWLRLGEVEEKLKDKPAAREAYKKFLEVASDAKNAGEVRKKLEKLK